jgi:AcrR family transcriptional regulator
MEIMAARGFSDVRLSDVARELHCSVATLYKIAPNKDSLVVLAVRHWGNVVLAYANERAAEGVTAAERAHRFFLAGAERTRPLSLAFREDVERFESARLAYTSVADEFSNRFASLLGSAADDGEIHTQSACFLARVFQELQHLSCDNAFIESCGLSSDTALIEVDSLIWNGIRKSSGASPLGSVRASRAAAPS